MLVSRLAGYRVAEPYTYTGEILTSVNPCKPIPKIYAADVMCSYAGRLLGGSRPPHLYAMAEEARIDETRDAPTASPMRWRDS